ncbi:MAG TPA: SDR family NAD(P)-dependent oxidoreductase, partial [Acidimicrobiales bacterium]|nr:SDR family NAD(P)-dependent oxidoreductase [Acidimicrobiales bacterium]
MGRLDGTVTLVTGAASGIGAACAERFAAEGAQVVTVDASGGTGASGAVDHCLDVRDEDAVRRAFDQVMSAHGRLDAVVHAAGVAGGGPVHLLDADEWDRVVDVNLKGTFLVGKYSALAMLPAEHGSIVNIASIEGLEGTEGGSAYNA